jgi:anti-sigma B factor antagonist
MLPGMSLPLLVQEIEHFTVVEFKTASLMDTTALEEIGAAVYRLVDEEDKRKIILDFSEVEFLSSQAIGIILKMKKKLDALPHSALILCGVGPKLMQLIKITNLHKILQIKPSQKEAVKVLVP